MDCGGLLGHDTFELNGTMDKNPLVLTCIMLLTLTLYISDVNMQSLNVTVHIWEGNVTVTWDPPKKNPRGCLYTVQITDYGLSLWENVTQCNLLNDTSCNIGTLFSGSTEKKVRVGVQTSNGSFYSKCKRFNTRADSQLLPPTFTLVSTPISVQVKVHRKELPVVFPYGLDYTAYLWPEGQQNQTQSDSDNDEDGHISFSSLQPYQVYCVRVQVKSESGASNISLQQCIQLPIDMALVICFIFLGLLAVVAILMIFVYCFLKRPMKKPDSLKPLLNTWQPMTVGLDQVETVTDKGWLLFVNKKEDNKQTSNEKTEVTEECKHWRERCDSGVSIEHIHPSVNNTRTNGQTEDIQEDSGCGSLKGAEGSGSARRATEHDHKTEGMEDSGLGMGHREVSSSLEGEDSGLFPEVVVGDGYRSQSPSSVDAKNDTSEAYNVNTHMASPSNGYRSGQVTCVCLDHEYCVWCKSKKTLTETCQMGTQVQTDLSQMICNTVDGDSAISNYHKRNNFQTIQLAGMEESVSQSVFFQGDMDNESSSFLFSCPLRLQNGENLDCTDTHSFTLEDVKLTFF